MMNDKGKPILVSDPALVVSRNFDLGKEGNK